MLNQPPKEEKIVMSNATRLFIWTLLTEKCYPFFLKK